MNIPIAMLVEIFIEPGGRKFIDDGSACSRGNDLHGTIQNLAGLYIKFSYVLFQKSGGVRRLTGHGYFAAYLRLREAFFNLSTGNK